MESNNNQMLLLAVAAVALYFFMKYRKCSRQENFSSLNINDKKRWHDRWRDNMIACGLKRGEKNCKKTKKGFDSNWNACKANQTNICLQENNNACNDKSYWYKIYKERFEGYDKAPLHVRLKGTPKYYKDKMDTFCNDMKSLKCHPEHTDGDCI